VARWLLLSQGVRKTIFAILFVAGCGASAMTLVEPSEVVVTGKPPTPMEETARVVVKRDRILVSEEILFDTDRATIQPESTSLLDEIASVLAAHPELVKVRIEGHTDALGSTHKNRELSEKRAVAVRAYLIERGVDAHRLIAEGFGADNPIAPNDTEEGRAKNRRVAFTVLDRIEGDIDEEITTTHKHKKDGAS
jgi:OmpA-OmpF porin, OOP family